MSKDWLRQLEKIAETEPKFSSLCSKFLEMVMRFELEQVEFVLQEQLGYAMTERPVILVVDDAPSSLGVLCEALEQAGYTVLIAKDGETALERLELVTPDAILLDAMMPGLSGFDTCRRIKETPGWMHIPIIFMTGLSDTEYVLEGFSSGGVDYVVKPIRVHEVLARLKTHVNNAFVTRLARDAI